VIPVAAHAATLFFKDGDYIEGRRIYTKQGNVYLEVVRGAGGTLIYKLSEIDVEKTFPRHRRAVAGKAIDSSQHVESNPDTTQHRNVDSSAVNISMTKRDEDGAAALPDTQLHETRQLAADTESITDHIQAGTPVGYMKSINEKEADVNRNAPDATKYYGQIGSDGRAVFINNEGKALRGTIGKDGIGTVQDENLQTIPIRPRP
jgi:hypothetical protein